MVQNLSEAKKVLVLSLRHLGDAVMLAGLLNGLAAGTNSVEVDVLGRLDLQRVTERFCTVHDYIPIELPIFGHHQKNLGATAAAMRKILMLRRRHYDVCLNLTGDIRENLVGWMTGAKVTMAPLWPDGHPFRRHIRTLNLPRIVTHPVPVPPSTPGYYDSMEHFVRQLGAAQLSWPSVAHLPEMAGRVIAIHPGASHESKRWPPDKWKQLIQILSADGYRIRLYGSPSEGPSLRREYSAEVADCGLDVVIGDISEFLDSLSGAALLVGMDSFSVHAAHALGIPTVALHGPYDPLVMTPPSGVPLSAGALCPIFPCYRGKACSNTQAKYICVQGINVTDVVSAIRAIRDRLSAAAPEEPFK